MMTKRLALAIVLAAAVALLRARPSRSRTSRSTATTSRTPTRAPVVTARTRRSARSRGRTSSTRHPAHRAARHVGNARCTQFCYACHDATQPGRGHQRPERHLRGHPVRHSGRHPQRWRFRLASTARRRPRPTCTRVRRGAPTAVATSAPGKTWRPTAKRSRGHRRVHERTGNAIKMDCATCHDPHGSPNYRILKAVVNGNTVGGYEQRFRPYDCPELDPDPDGFVSLGRDRLAGQRLPSPHGVPGYEPNYTSRHVRQGLRHAGRQRPTDRPGRQRHQGHERLVRRLPHHVHPATSNPSNAGWTTERLATYNAGDGGGLTLRHRHPINVELSTYNGPDKAVDDRHRQPASARSRIIEQGPTASNDRFGLDRVPDVPPRTRYRGQDGWLGERVRC